MSYQYGYTLDKDGNVSSLTSLYAATKYFEKKFRERTIDLESVYKFSLVDFIEADHIQDYSKDYTNNRAPEDDRAQNEPIVRTDIVKKKICWVGQVLYKNTVGRLDEHVPVKDRTFDRHFYYITFRKYWFRRWATNYYPTLPRFRDKDGITLHIDVPYHAVQNKQDRVSTLVIVTGDLKIYYMPIYDIRKWSDKVGLKTDKWNQTVIGIPKTMLLEQDPNVYE